MRGLLFRLLAIVLAAFVVAVPTAAAGSPGAALERCERFDINDADHVRTKLEAADTVFEGRVMAARRRQGPGGKTQFVHVVQVVAVYAGEVGVSDRHRVITIAVPQDGLGRLQGQARYLFFTIEQPNGALVAGACSGTTELDQPLPDSQAALINQLVAEAAEAEGQVALAEPPGGVTEPPSLTRLAAPGLALSLLGLLGLLLVIAIGSRRQN